MTWLALVSATLALAACEDAPAGVGTPTAATTVASGTNGVRVLTQRDHGKTVALRTGRTATLRVRATGSVKATGGAVRLSQVDYFADPGYREWEVRAVRAGTTVVTGPRTGGGRFSITLRVTAG